MSTPPEPNAGPAPAEPRVPASGTATAGGPGVPPEVPETLILGLGNLLLRDEGVGVHVLRRLEQALSFPPEVELLDGGTAGMDLLPHLAGRRRLLMIDAIVAKPDDLDSNGLRILRDEAIRAALTEKVSLHHLGLADLLAMAELLGDLPAQVTLIGVPPERLELGTDLSERVAGQIPRIIALVLAELARWGVRDANDLLATGRDAD